MKSVLLLLLTALTLAGCAKKHDLLTALPVGDIERGRQSIIAGEAACVLLPVEGDMIALNGRGVAPLLQLYDEHREAMVGGVICDKIIGRATAAIAICGQVRHVHSEMMSEDAANFLTAHGITVSASTFVPRILNRRMDGLCPMEQAVEPYNDPETAVAALRKKLQAMQQPKEQTP